MRFNRYALLGALCAVSLVAAADTSDAGLHNDWLDKSVDPTQNFFGFANGGWQKQNPIPAAYARWGTFNVLLKQNQEVLHGILDDLSKQKNLKKGSIDQKAGDFYAIAMDEQAADATGIKPLQAEFDAINSITDGASLQAEIAHLQMIGVRALFNFGQIQDFKDSSKVIGAAFQGGLGLPDRDYYLKTADNCTAPAAAPAGSTATSPAKAAYDACIAQADKFQKVRDAYVTHVTNMFKLLGDDPTKAANEATTVMYIENQLAKVSMSRVDQRTPENIYHPMDLATLDTTTPGFSWEHYFAAIGHPEIKSINLAMPDFFKGASDYLNKVSLGDWETYLRWHTVDAFAPYLSKPFVDEDFAMTKALTGAQELLPRWQRVVASQDNAMGFALGKLYVEKKFPKSSKKAVEDILHGIRGALKTTLRPM